MYQTSRSRLATTRVIASAIAASGLLLAATAPSRADPTSPEGLWYTKNSESIIKVHPCDKAMCGTVVWLKEPMETDGSPKVDKLNTDPLKKDKPLVGLDVLLGMVAVKDHWKGKAYNADDGKVYDITFTVKTDKVPDDQADIRGCVLGFLCRTETFNRAPEVPGGDPTIVAATPPGATPAKQAKAAHLPKKETAHK